MNISIADLHAKAENGDASAQNDLGLRYLNGDGVPQSYETSLKWLRLSASTGNANALCTLGFCYYNGMGVVRNHPTAARLFHQAAQKGLAAAQHNLAQCYLNGQGVPQSYENAFKWIKSAAQKGHTSSYKTLGGLYYYGRGTKQDYDAAALWFTKLAELDQPDGYRGLGLCCEVGFNAYAWALHWYQKALDRGMKAAADDIARVKRKLSAPPSAPAPTVSRPAEASAPPSPSYQIYPRGTFSGLDRDSSVSFVNRCLQDDLAFCCSEEEREQVKQRYLHNYPDTPLEF